MKAEISVRAYRRTFRAPLRTAYGKWRLREGFIVRMESAEAVGYGEIAPIPDFGTETLERAAKFLEQWAVDSIIMPSGLPCCSFALSTAMQQLKQPACVDARDYPVTGLLPAGPDAINRAREKSATGYNTLKWKIGVHPFEAEKEIFEELLALLPESVSLRLDANGGLGKNELEAWLETLSRRRGHVDYLEQPLPPGKERLMAELAEASGIPIALDESLNMSGRGRWLTPGAWQGPLVIKPLLMGNIAPLLEQLRPLAGQLVISSVFETGIGLFHALDLANALPEMKYAIGFDTMAAFSDDLSGLTSQPLISAKDLGKIDLEAIWNQLSPLS